MLRGGAGLTLNEDARSRVRIILAEGGEAEVVLHLPFGARPAMD
jgi:hypothetical protein